MKSNSVRTLGILFCILITLLASNSLAAAQSQKDIMRKSIFNLQFVLTISWDGADTETPIAAGEIRVVHLTILSSVTRGAFGKFLLQLLEGTPYIIHTSILESPEWCSAWLTQEDFIGTIHTNEVSTISTLLYIQLNDEAPSNYSLGWVKLQSLINDKKGPFGIITLIHGYEQKFTLTFVTGP